MITAESLSHKGNRFFEVTVEPSTEPVTADEVKEWARIDGIDEDNFLESVITSVRKLVEKYICRALISQKIELVMDYWPGKVIELPYSPVISIDSVVTLDEDDTATTYSSDNYYLQSTGGPDKLIIKQDSTNPENENRDYSGFKITYYAGYGTAADDVPQTIKDAIKMWVSEVYENRIMSDEAPKMVEGILKPFRIKPT